MEKQIIIETNEKRRNTRKLEINVRMHTETTNIKLFTKIREANKGDE